MMSMAAPRCYECRHFHGWRRCAAFPRRIPNKIFFGDVEHDRPVKGDQGIQFEKFEPFTDISRVREDLLSFLPEPREVTGPDENGVITCCSGDPPEVTVMLTPTEVRVSRCAFLWKSPHELLEDPRLIGTVNWREPFARIKYRELVADAQARRRGTFRRCRFCGEKFGPEHRHSKDFCDSCAETHLGIVH